MSDFEDPYSDNSEHEMDDSMRYVDSVEDGEPIGGYCHLAAEDVPTLDTVPSVGTERGLWDSVEGEEIEALEGTETEESQEGMETEWVESQAELAEGEAEEEWAEQGLEGEEMLEEETLAYDENADGADAVPGEHAAEEEEQENEEVEWLMEEALSEDGLQGDPEEEPPNPGEDPADPEEETADPEEETADPKEVMADQEEEPFAPEDEPADPEEEPFALEEEPADPKVEPTALEEDLAAQAGATEDADGVGDQRNDSTEDLLRLLGEGDAAAEEVDSAPAAVEAERGAAEQDDEEEDEEVLAWTFNYVEELKSSLAGKTLSRKTNVGSAVRPTTERSGAGITGKLRSVRKQTKTVTTEEVTKRKIEDVNSSQENQQKKQKTSHTIKSSVTTRSRIDQDKKSDSAPEREEKKVPEEIYSDSVRDSGQEIFLEKNGVRLTKNGSGMEDNSDDSTGSESFNLSYEMSDVAERKSEARRDGTSKRVRFAELPPSSDYDDSEDLFDDTLDDVTSEEEEPPEYKFSLDVRSERAGEFLPLLGRDAAALLQTESERLRVALGALARERAAVRERQREAARTERELRARLAQLQRATP